MNSIFSQLLLLVALLMGQQQSWAENNCQHKAEQDIAFNTTPHSNMDHGNMDHKEMNHDMGDMTTSNMENCCDDCSCDFNSCHNQSVNIADGSDWTFDSANKLNKLSPVWQLSQNTTPLLRPPSLT